VRWRWLVCMAVLAAMAGTGCQRAAQDVQDGESRTIAVVAKEFAFEPKEIRVKAGRVQFLVKNIGTVEHDFMIVGVAEHGGAHGTETFKPGETYTLVADLTPGTYVIECGVAGHKEAGMTAALIVEQ
jgi:uncharacterized cupredoxin-like copper-binding protein